MNLRTIVQALRTAVAVAAFGALSCGSMFASPVRIAVTVDTTSLADGSGFVGLSFSPGVNSQPSTATLTEFAGVVFTGPADVMGGVTGSLPGTVILDDSSQDINTYLQAVTYGPSISFLLTLDLIPQAGVFTSPAAFGFAMLDSAYNPLLTTDPFGFALQVDFDSQGNAIATAFPAGPDLPSAVSAEAIPEPSAFVLAALGVVGMLLRRCYKAGRLSNR